MESIPENNLNPANYDFLTFDCYGTLVDWETAIVDCLQEILLFHDAHWNDFVLLELFSEWEPLEQANGGSYREVLQRILLRYGQRLGFTLSRAQIAQFEECIARADAFDDTASVLKKLSGKFQLGIISNTDNDLFQITLSKLDTEFACITTAQDVGAYKPNLEVFQHALNQIGKNQRVLHIGQSLYHDVLPATQLGLDVVWIDRTNGATGATRSASVEPTWKFFSLREFCDALLSD